MTWAYAESWRGLSVVYGLHSLVCARATAWRRQQKGQIFSQAWQVADLQEGPRSMAARERDVELAAAQLRWDEAEHPSPQDLVREL